MCPALCLFPRMDKYGNPCDDGNKKIPAVHKEITDCHDCKRDTRQFSADFVKLGSKGRHNLNHHDGYNNDNNKNQDDRINRRLDDQPLQVGLFFKLASHTAERFIQSTGGFPCGNHLHHEVWKNLRVLRHRNGEGLPTLYGIPHFCDCVGKRFVLGLLG